MIKDFTSMIKTYDEGYGYTKSRPNMSLYNLLSNSDHIYVINNGMGSGVGRFTFYADWQSISNSLGSLIDKITSISLEVSVNITNMPPQAYNERIVFSQQGNSIVNYPIIDISGQNTLSLKSELNPATNERWTIEDLKIPFTFEFVTAGYNPFIVYSMQFIIYYESDEVFNAPLGFIKVKTSNNGIIQIPFFEPKLLKDSSIRIKTHKGVGAFSLANISSPNASPVRIKTHKGVYALAYIP